MLPAQILANVDPQAVLARFIGEEPTKDIAKSLGVSRPALTSWLIKVAEEDWKDAQVVRAIEKKEKAEDEIEGIALKLKSEEHPPSGAEIQALGLLHKVSESQLRAAQWDLERLYRKIYGDQAPDAASVVIIAIGTELRPEKPPIEGHAVRTP